MSDDVLWRDGDTLPKLVERVERTHLARALNACGGRKKQAAILLGLTFRQIRYMIKKYEAPHVDS